MHLDVAAFYRTYNHRYRFSWWKVKIKGESQEEDSPVGLVPAAYVEPVRRVKL